MKTVYYSERGAARDVLKFADVPTPEPGPGEVRVRVHASGLNPSDVKTRSGMSGPMTAPRTVPGCDGAGVVTAVGAGVPGRRVGERVWLFNVNRNEAGNGQGERGTSSEEVVVGARYAVPLPHGVSFEVGACMGVPAMTAHRAVLADGPVTGQTVLVTGGAGAVGQMAIQIAKWSGAAKIIATVSSEEKARFARDDGADATVNYKTEDVAARVLELNGGRRVDRIVDVDFGANYEVATKILKTDGVIAGYDCMSNRTPPVPFRTYMGLNATIHAVLVYVMGWPAKEAAIRDVTAMLEAGVLEPRIAKTFPLAEIVAAHEMQEKGAHIGNIVVTLP